MEISNSPLVLHRNWLELSRDIMLTILNKLEASQLINSVQHVCQLWFILCKEPSIWRTIRVSDWSICHVLRDAVDRSAGGLIDLDIEGICMPELFSYVLSRSSQLKRLRLARCCCMSVLEVKEALEKLSSLEELELALCFNPPGVKIIPTILSLRSLTTFKLNKRFSPIVLLGCDDEALAIAAGMPNLRHLQLLGNNMTNVGLTAILDGCPLLEFLDLRACFKLDLSGNLGKRLLENIKDLLRPDDSTEDCKCKHVVVYFYDYDDIPEDSVSDNDFDIIAYRLRLSNGCYI